MNASSQSFSPQPPSATPRKAKAGPPLSWISESVRMLREHWAVVLPAYFLVMLVTTLIQLGVFTLVSDSGVFAMVLAGVVGMVVAVLLNAGIVTVFHGVAEQRARFSDVFAGFNGHTILHVVLMLVMMVLIALALGVVGYLVTDFSAVSGSAFGPGGLGSLMDGGYGPQGAVMAIVFMIIAVFCLLAVFAALFSYVIPLIVVSRQGVFHAMSNSFRASFKNMFVLLFFGVNAIVFMQLVLIPVFIIGAASASTVVMSLLVFLTSLAWGAVLSGAYYLSFRDTLLAGTPPRNDASQESAIPA